MRTKSHRRALSAGFLVMLAVAAVTEGHGGSRFWVLGGGKYSLATSAGDIEAKFAMFGIQSAYRTRGRFRHALEFQGLPIEFHGKITCLAVDPDEGRVWVGGVITRNLSMHPGFMGDIHEPGKDIWFRVLDSGKHTSEPDRTTFVGFEGSADIITSQEYCDTRPWPDDNARTNPVIQGNIKLKVR